MKLQPWWLAVVAALLLSSGGTRFALADEAPGYLSRIVGGAKNLLPRPSNAPTTEKRPRQSSPRPAATAKLGQGKAMPARPVHDKKAPAVASGVEPAGWNATAEQQAAATRLSSKSPARLTSRPVVAQAEAKPPRTVSQFMAQERP
jgi:hypothetical protein